MRGMEKTLPSTSLFYPFLYLAIHFLLLQFESQLTTHRLCEFEPVFSFLELRFILGELWTALVPIPYVSPESLKYKRTEKAVNNAEQ